MSTAYDAPLPPDPAQEMADGLKSGSLRYTPQQKQQIQRNAATRAWLVGNEVPDQVRQRELARLDEADKRIMPMPVPPDEVPPSTEEHLLSNAWVDRDGIVSHPGTTWVRNERGGWDIPRSVPNNQIEYVREMAGQQPETIPPPGEGDILAQRGYQRPFQSYHEQEAAKSASQMYSAQGKQQANASKQAMAAQAYQQRVHEAQLRRQRQQEQDEQRRAEKERAEAREQFETLRKRALQIVKESATGPFGTEKEPVSFEDAFKRAESEETVYAQRYSPESKKLTKDYGDYLRDKYVGVNFARLQDTPEGRVELNRRKGKTVEAPKNWERQVPIPESSLAELQKLPPEDLEDFRKHAQGRPFTKEEYSKDNPKGNYARYMAVYRWAREAGKHGPLTVPGAQTQPAQAQVAPQAGDAVQRAINAAQSGDAAAQQALEKRGIRWQPR